MDRKLLKNIQEENNKKSTPINLFYTSSPRNATNGAINGICNLGLGILTGLAGFLVLPIHFSQEEGLKGFFKGGGIGLIMLITLPLGGLVCGLGQLAKGIWNSPSAYRNRKEGKVWNSKLKKWYFYKLSEEKEKIFSQNETDFISINNTTATEVKDKELYNVLNISPDASTKDIKKQYYKLAKITHPDKSHEDAEKFHKINEAYQILSDPVSRDKYNRLGKDGIINVSLIDSKQLYTILFGTQQLDFYLGDISLYTLMAADSNNETIKELLEFKQSKREIIIAENIIKLVDFYKKNNSNDKNLDFYETTRKNISINPLSSLLIHFLGTLYCDLGHSHLGYLSSIGIRFKSQLRFLKYKYALVSLALKKKNKEDESKIMKIIINTILEDIETTILESTKKIFDDFSISDQEKNTNARALIFIGEIFKKSNYDYSESLIFLNNIVNPPK
jgi:curved DNA-binding protein CbpA